AASTCGVAPSAWPNRVADRPRQVGTSPPMVPQPPSRRRRWALALAALAAGSGLAACGQSDQDKIKDAVRNYIQAVLDDNGKAACDLLTADAAKAFVDKVKAQ